MAVNAPVIPAMEAGKAEGLLGLQPASLAKQQQRKKSTNTNNGEI